MLSSSNMVDTRKAYIELLQRTTSKSGRKNTLAGRFDLTEDY